MPLPPSLMIVVITASLGFFLLFKAAFLYSPFSPGPTLVSVESALWHTEQLVSNVSWPFLASAANAGATASKPRQPIATSGFFIGVPSSEIRSAGNPAVLLFYNHFHRNAQASAVVRD